MRTLIAILGLVLAGVVTLGPPTRPRPLDGPPGAPKPPCCKVVSGDTGPGRLSAPRAR